MKRSPKDDAERIEKKYEAALWHNRHWAGLPSNTATADEQRGMGLADALIELRRLERFRAVTECS